MALLVAVFLLAGAASPAAAQPAASGRHPDIALFFEAADPEDEDAAEAALAQIADLWRDGYAAILRDMMRLMQPPARRPVSFNATDPTRTEPAFEFAFRREHPSTKVWRRIMEFLEDQTGERFRGDMDRLQHWIWSQPYDPHPDYALFKGEWYAAIDGQFRQFFPRGVEASIRLDEIDWGGVVVNGIPPLEYPRTLRLAPPTTWTTTMSSSASRLTARRAPTPSGSSPGTRWRSTGSVDRSSPSFTARCAGRSSRTKA